MRALALGLTVLALSAAGVPLSASASETRPTVGEISSEVMCPVCGTLLALAESPQATREKAFVEKLAKEGKNKSQIKEALVNQYGDAVLALPKSSGFTLSAYVVPIVGFIESFGPFRMSAASFSVINFIAINSAILPSTQSDLRTNSVASHSRIFLRMNIALVQM